MECEHPNFAHYSMPEPEVHTGLVVLAGEVTKPELTCVNRRASAEEKETVHKLPERIHRHRPIPVKAPDAQAGGRLPEVAPPPGEHARPHGHLRGRNESTW
uniref:Uncharacterized protein n=1 Tax=Arundo donax TaxID=35708 RepID=A0A0A9HI54_ARUDO